MRVVPARLDRLFIGHGKSFSSALDELCPSLYEAREKLCESDVDVNKITLFSADGTLLPPKWSKKKKGS